MNHLIKKIFLLSISLLFLPGVNSAKESLKFFNYYSGLIEYYACYSNQIGSKELEEAYIALYPKKYDLNWKNDIKKKEDLETVSNILQKAIDEVNQNGHEYKIYLKADIGNYNFNKQGFECNIISKQNCLEIRPVKNTGLSAQNDDEEYSIIERGIQFNKLSIIKLFFVNTEDFNVLKYPAEKAKKFIEKRTDKTGVVNREIYVMIDIEILPGHKNEYKQQLISIVQNAGLQREESYHYMLAKIKNITIYNDTDLKEKLGKAENIFTAIQVK